MRKKADFTDIPVESSHSRDKILDAAEKLFMEKGFDAASIRDITSEAGCNVAAVNYHFGNKKNLYLEMFSRFKYKMFSFHIRQINEIMARQDVTLDMLLRETVRSAVASVKTESTESPLIKLMVRELLNPHLHDEQRIDDIVVEFINVISAAIMKFYPRLDLQTAQLCVYALDGMILHVMLFSEHYMLINPGVNYDIIAEHIVRSVIAMIQNYAQEVD